MKKYIIEYSDLMGKKQIKIKAINETSAVLYLVNWLSWGQATIYSIKEEEV